MSQRAIARRRLLLGAVGAALPAPAWAIELQPDFTLQDADGRSHRLSAFRGKVVVLTFGYAQCPDVCPTTLLTLADVMRTLGEAARHVQVLWVTVDPQRDTPAVVRAYAQAFDPRFIGLRGSATATRRAADAFGVTYSRNPGPTPTSYTVDHTAGVYLIDPTGTPRVFVAYDVPASTFERDLRRLLAMLPG